MSGMMMTIRPVAVLIALTSALPIRAQSTTETPASTEEASSPPRPVPPRSESGQSLIIPEEQMDLGEMYFVSPGQDAQIVCTSAAPLRRIALTSHRVVGYAIASFEPDQAEKLILAGAFRLPARSLTTGNRQQDELLQSLIFNAAEHPETTFVVTDMAPHETGARDGDFETYASKKLTGELTLRGVTKTVEFPVTVSIMPCDVRRTFSRGPGDFLSIRGRLEIRLADFGWSRPRQLSSDVLADTLGVEVFLMLCTVPPEATLDPAVDRIAARRAQHLKEMKLITLLRDMRDAEEGYAFARTYAKEVREDADALRRLADLVIDEEGLERRDLGWAMQVASRACELTRHENGDALGTLARVYYEIGDLQSAVAWQRKAVQHTLPAPPNPFAGPTITPAQRLAQYEEEAKLAGVELSPEEKTEASAKASEN